MAKMSHLGFWRHVPGYPSFSRFLSRRAAQGQARHAFDLSFPSYIGLAPGFDRKGLWINDLACLGYGFLTVDSADLAPSVLTERLALRRPEVPVFTQVLANGPSEESIFQHVVRTFSLLYDFSDAFVVSTADVHNGIASLDDISELSNLLDELISVRICYEQYRPILLRLGRSCVGDDLDATVDYCRLSGIDGLILSDVAQIRAAQARSGGRLQFIGSVPESSLDTAQAMISAGAVLLEMGSGYTGSRIRTARPVLKWLKHNPPAV